jgi:hypothetical protein
MDGNCILVQAFGPLRLLLVVDVRFLTADLDGYLGLFLKKLKKLWGVGPGVAQIALFWCKTRGKPLWKVTAY